MRLASLLPALSQLRGYLEAAIDFAERELREHRRVTVHGVTVYLSIQMRDWNPTIKGVRVLDDETRQAAARFLAGVAFNIVTGAMGAARRTA